MNATRFFRLVALALSLFLPAAAVPVVAAPPPGAAAAPASTDGSLEDAVGWLNGVAGRIDPVRGHALLDAFAEAGDPRARLWVARWRATGRYGYERDPAAAVQAATELLPAVRALAAAGDLTAQFLVATVTDAGLGVAADPGHAAELYRQVCAADHPVRASACNNLGLQYDQGHGIPGADVEARHFYGLACGQGSLIACENLGNLWAKGEGGAVDGSRAAELYGRSCAGASGSACVALGKLYRDGKLLARDADRALDLFAKACDLGESDGCKARDALCTSDPEVLCGCQATTAPLLLLAAGDGDLANGRRDDDRPRLG